jgi:hypothetical protein
VHGLTTASAVMDWSYGASILTFVFPMLLFIAVAAGLYVVYTKPHLVPGHRYNMQMRAITATAAPETTALGRPAMPPAVDTDTITGLERPTNEG